MLKNKRVLITGALGFVGKHLIESTLRTGMKIIAVDLLKPGENLVEQYGDAVTWIQADLLKDDLSNFLSGVDTVYHLAAAFLPGNLEKITDTLCMLNVEGTRKVAAASVKAGVRQFMHVSSVAACEWSGDVRVTEDTGKPVSSYGYSKLKSEQVLKEIANHKMNYTIFRPTAMFGEYHLGSVFELVKAIHQKKFIIIGTGRNHVNFLYVKDFAAILTKAAEKPEMTNQTYIVADTPITLNELTDFIRQEVDMPPNLFKLPTFIGLSAGFAFDILSRIAHRPMPLSVNRVRAMTRDICYSNERLKALSIKFDCGIFDGLKRAIVWYKSQGLL